MAARQEWDNKKTIYPSQGAPPIRSRAWKEMCDTILRRLFKRKRVIYVSRLSLLPLFTIGLISLAIAGAFTMAIVTEFKSSGDR